MFVQHYNVRHLRNNQCLASFYRHRKFVVLSNIVAIVLVYTKNKHIKKIEDKLTVDKIYNSLVGDFDDMISVDDIKIKNDT